MPTIYLRLFAHVPFLPLFTLVPSPISTVQKLSYLKDYVRNSLVVQWLGLHAFTAEGPGSIPSQGTKIPQARQHGQKKKKNAYVSNATSSNKPALQVE